MEGIVRKTAEESQELIPAPGSCLRIWGRPAHCLFLREEMALVTVCFPVACLTSSGERKKRQRGTKNSSVLAVAAWGFCWVLAQDISLCSFATCCLWNGCDSVIALLDAEGQPWAVTMAHCSSWCTCTSLHQVGWCQGVCGAAGLGSGWMRWDPSCWGSPQEGRETDIFYLRDVGEETYYKSLS